MGLKFLFRKDERMIPFREAILQLLKLPGEDIILSSGYITNVFSYKDKSTGKYIETEFRNSFYEYMKEKDSNKKIIILCGMIDDGVSKESPNLGYKSFLGKTKFMSEFDRNYKINAYITKEDRYHGKVAIKLKDGKPIAAIVGSSNFTKSALLFEEERPNSNYFNNESDMLIISNKHDKEFNFDKILVSEFNENNINIRKLLKTLNYEESYENINIVKEHIIKGHGKMIEEAVSKMSKEEFIENMNIIDTLPSIGLEVGVYILEEKAKLIRSIMYDIFSNNYKKSFETYKNLRVIEAEARDEYIQSVLDSIYEDISSYIEDECLLLEIKASYNELDWQNIRASKSSVLA